MNKKQYEKPLIKEGKKLFEKKISEQNGANKMNDKIIDGNYYKAVAVKSNGHLILEMNKIDVKKAIKILDSIIVKLNEYKPVNLTENFKDVIAILNGEKSK
jgi:hypothetical protein